MYELKPPAPARVAPNDRDFVLTLNKFNWMPMLKGNITDQRMFLKRLDRMSQKTQKAYFDSVGSETLPN